MRDRINEYVKVFGGILVLIIFIIIGYSIWGDWKLGVRLLATDILLIFLCFLVDKATE